MTNEEKSRKNGNTFAAVGGLLTVLSLTIIKEDTWQIVTAGLGVVLALYGVTLIKKGKK